MPVRRRVVKQRQGFHVDGLWEIAIPRTLAYFNHPQPVEVPDHLIHLIVRSPAQPAIPGQPRMKRQHALLHRQAGIHHLAVRSSVRTSFGTRQPESRKIGIIGGVVPGAAASRIALPRHRHPARKISRAAENRGPAFLSAPGLWISAGVRISPSSGGAQPAGSGRIRKAPRYIDPAASPRHFASGMERTPHAEEQRRFVERPRLIGKRHWSRLEGFTALGSQSAVNCPFDHCCMKPYWVSVKAK